MNLIIYFIGILLFLTLLATAAISYYEKENTAFKRSLLISIFSPIPFYIIAYCNINILSISTIILIFLTGMIIFFPSIKSFRIHKKWTQPITQIDERNIMFSREKLKPETHNFKNYYKANPEKKYNDDKFRNNPGLLGDKSHYYNTFVYEATNANFFLTEHLKSVTIENPNKIQKNINPKNVTNFIKNWMLSTGVIDIGFSKLEKYHLYSHHGYRAEYGKKVENSHKYVIAFLVEMDKDMIARSPKSPIILESSHQYLNAGVQAVALAKFIRNLGYSAQAHIDGKYEIVAPLVARDCGLGEIGRMGLLISNKLGPRVRIAAVTTDIPLSLSTKNPNNSVEQFCKVCLKCADICPSQAIPIDNPKVINGIERWQIDQEKCFHIWTKFGTDCGRCIQVCPYSHPNNLFHNSIRFGIKHFPVFRKIAAKLDDLFYGKLPNSLELKNWMKN